MTGSDYVAVVRLTDKIGKVLAMPGDRCTEVPESSLGWLASDGLIRLQPAAIDKPLARARRKQGEE
jgi:hypothetical protein